MQLACLLTGSRIALAAEAAEKGDAAANKVEAKDTEPSAEDVARRFLAALLTRDEVHHQALLDPFPRRRNSVAGLALNDQMRAAAKERMAIMKFRRLKAGDKVTAPDGKEYTVEAIQVNEGRLLLLPEGLASLYPSTQRPWLAREG